MAINYITSSKKISLKEAVMYFGYSSDHIAYLIRKGKIAGEKIREKDYWKVSKKGLLEYLNGKGKRPFSKKISNFLISRKYFFKNYLSLKEASEISGYASDYIGYLVRQGKVPGKKFYRGMNWLTTRDAVKEYVDSKKGRSGERFLNFSFSSRGGKKFFSLRISKVGFASILAVLFLAGLAVFANSLQDQVQTVRIFPSQIQSGKSIGGQGWWNGEEIKGAPDVGPTGDINYFSDQNSAVYKGGAGSLSLSGFSNTQMDLDSEDLIKDIGNGREESGESGLPKEEEIQLPQTGGSQAGEDSNVSDSGQPEETSDDGQNPVEGGNEQKENEESSEVPGEENGDIEERAGSQDGILERDGQDSENPIDSGEMLPDPNNETSGDQEEVQVEKIPQGTGTQEEAASQEESQLSEGQPQNNENIQPANESDASAGQVSFFNRVKGFFGESTVKAEELSTFKDVSREQFLSAKIKISLAGGEKIPDVVPAGQDEASGFWPGKIWGKIKNTFSSIFKNLPQIAKAQSAESIEVPDQTGQEPADPAGSVSGGDGDYEQKPAEEIKAEENPGAVDGAEDVVVSQDIPQAVEESQPEGEGDAAIENSEQSGESGPDDLPSEENYVPVQEADVLETPAGEKEIPSEEIVPTPDDKIIIWYAVDDGSESVEWQKLGTVSQESFSNASNGGYLSFEASFLRSWGDIENLRIRIDGAIGGQLDNPIYLDSFWVEAEYQNKELSDFELKPLKSDWGADEEPSFELIRKAPKESLIEKIFSGIGSAFGIVKQTEPEPEIKADLLKPGSEARKKRLEKLDGGQIVQEIFSEGDQEKREIKIPQLSFGGPGKYTFTVTVENNGEFYDFTQDFTWGVLVVNTNKSIYLPGDQAYLQMGVLDEKGNTVCNADLEMEITAPDGSVNVLRTKEFTADDNSFEETEVGVQKEPVSDEVLEGGEVSNKENEPIAEEQEEPAIEESLGQSQPFAEEMVEIEEGAAEEETLEGVTGEEVPFESSDSDSVSEESSDNSQADGETVQAGEDGADGGEVQETSESPQNDVQPGQTGQQENDIKPEENQSSGEEQAGLLDKAKEKMNRIFDSFALAGGSIANAAVVSAEEENQAVGEIYYSGKCGANNIVSVPDYYAYYDVGQPGEYEIKLTAITANGEYVITDLFEARDQVPFDIERTGPSRIFPPADYQMKLAIKANEDFKGEVKETVPEGFEIDSPEAVQKDEAGVKKIIWSVDLKKGDSIELGYSFNAPDISPYLYLLGPLVLRRSDGIAFSEIRKWQIASDASISFVGSAVNSYSPTGNWSVTLPSGIRRDDLIIIAAAVGDTANNGLAAPTEGGYSRVPGVASSLYANDTYDTNLDLYYKVADGTETTATFAGVGGTNAANAGIVMVFRGVDPGSPFDTNANATTAINSSSANPPSHNWSGTSGAWTVIAAATGHVGGATAVFTFPAGYTTNAAQRAHNDTYDILAGMGYKTSPSDPEDPANFTAANVGTATNNGWAAVTMSLKPNSDITISGTVFTDEGNTTSTAGSVINLAVNGVWTASTTASTSTGAYSFSSVSRPSTSTVITVYTSNASEYANVVTRYSGSGNLTNFNLYKDRVIVRNEDSGPTTITDLDKYDQSNSQYMLYTASSTPGTLTVSSTAEFFVWTGDTFQTGGAAGAVSFGDVDINGTFTATSTQTVSVSGSWDATGGTFTSASSNVTFTATSTGKTVTVNSNHFYILTFNGSGGGWTLSDSVTTTNTLNVTAGTLTWGDGNGDNLVTGATTTIASGAIMQSKQDLAQGSAMTWTCNGNIANSGTLDLGKNTTLNFNSGSSVQYGLTLESTGKFELQGTQDDTGTSTSNTSETVIEDTSKSWTIDSHNGKVVRMTSGLSIGKVYDITDTTATTLVRADNSSINTTVASQSGTTVLTICSATTTLITADDEGIGRYLHDQTGTTGWFRIVDSISDDADNCGGNDMVKIIASPTASFAGLADGNTIAISDGIRSGDGFEIIDYATLTANSANHGYVYAKSGSETVIRYADVSEMGASSAGTSKDGLEFESVNGVNEGEGVTIENSRIHDGYMGIRLDSSHNNNSGYGKGISNNAVYNSGASGIFLDASNNNSVLYNNVYLATDYNIVTASADRNTVNYNISYNSPDGFIVTGNSNIFTGNAAYQNTETGFWITGSANNLLASNDLFGNWYYGILLDTDANNNGVFSNNVYANDAPGIYVYDSSDNNLLESNSSYGNAGYGLYLNGSNNNVLASNEFNANAFYGLYTKASAGTVMANESYGVVEANGSSDVRFSDTTVTSKARCYNCTMSSAATDVSNAVTSTAYFISFGHDGVSTSTKVWGEYSIPTDTAETPNDESTNKFNYASSTWEDSFTAHGYSGSGTEDGNLSFAFSGGAMGGSTSTAAYMVVCNSATTTWTVYKDGVSIGTATTSQTYTDSSNNVQFTVEAPGNNYAAGDAYTFAAFKGSDNTNTQKYLTMMQDGDTFTVPASTTLQLQGQNSTTNRTQITRGNTGGYSFNIAGTINAQYYDFNYLGGTLGNNGLNLQTGATVTSLDYGSFDNFASTTIASSSYITINTSLISTSTPSKTLTGLSFTNTGSNANYNVRATSTAVAGYWNFVNTTGSFSGETNDYDISAAPGEIRWDASSGITVSGYVFTDEGNTTSTAGSVINLAVNGVWTASTTASTSTGAYSFSSVSQPSTSTVLTVYTSNASEYANAVTRYSGSGNLTGLDLYKDRVIVRSEDGSPVTIANLDKYDQSNSQYMLYTASSTPATLSVSSTAEFYVKSSNTFQTGGAAGAVSFGDVDINGTFTATSTQTISVSGSWDATGGTFTPVSSTVQFTATSTGKTITVNSNPFYNLTFNGSGGGWTFGDAATTTNDLTITAGTASSTYDMSVLGGDVTGAGTLYWEGVSTFLVDGTGNFGGSSFFHFYNLTFGDGSGESTTTASGSDYILATGVLTVAANHTLEAGGATWDLSNQGTPFVISGTFDSQTSTFYYSSAWDTNIASTNYYDLRLQPYLVFSDGFETNDFSEWDSFATTSGSVLVTTSTQAYAGTYSLGFKSGGVDGYAELEKYYLGEATTSIIDFYLYIPSDFSWGTASAINIIGMSDNSWNNRLSLGIEDWEDIRLTYSYWDSSSVLHWNDGGVNLSKGQWHHFRVEDSVDASDGYIKIWLNGSLVVNNTGINTGSTNIDNIYSGSTWADGEHSVLYEDNISFYNVPTYTLGTAGSQTITAANDLTVGDGTNGVNVTGAIQNPVIDVNGNVSIATSSALIAPISSSFNVAGSWSNLGIFNNSSSTVTFDAGAVGKTIDTGDSSFYNVSFDNASGGWTVVGDATSTNNWAIANAAAFALSASKTIEVGGQYSVGNSVPSITTWNSGSVLYLNSGTGYTVGSKDQSQEDYAGLEVGADTDIRMWNSSSSAYTIDASGSLYSMDHNNIDGSAYIWGDFHTDANDYLSYANDFDGTLGANRQCQLTIASGAAITVDSGDSLEIKGGGTASNDVTTISYAPASGSWNLNNNSGSEMLIQEAAIGHMKVNAGTVTVLNTVLNDEAEPDAGAVLNVDWYLGAHLVDKDSTGHNIDTDGSDITVSEAGSNTVIYQYNGTSWSGPVSSTTTDSGADGKTPQPNSGSAIRIREYQQTAATTTYYRYNLAVAAGVGFSAYDYYNNWGNAYITSVSSTESSGVDKCISESWQRDEIGAMNTPYSSVNEPPTNGSWYIGMSSDLQFSIDSSSVDLGTLSDGNNWTATGTTMLYATTSYEGGYSVTAYASEDGRLRLGETGNYIERWNYANSAPAIWDVNCEDNAGYCGFGYTTSDTTLGGTGESNRFASGTKYAGFATSSPGDLVADSAESVSGTSTAITYKASAKSSYAGGVYDTTVYYLCTVNY